MNIILFLLFQNISGFGYTSYQTKIECNSKNAIVAPKSINELQSIVNSAISSNTKMKVIGSLYSITDVICTDGIPISMKNFNKVAVDKNNMTATIEVGLSLQDTFDTLNRYGVTLNDAPDYSGPTIGGIISLGSHGSSLKHHSSLSEYLIGVTFIDGQGNLRKIQEGDPDFDAFRVSLGLIGIFIDVTLKIFPSYKLTVKNYYKEDGLLTNTPNSLLDLAKMNERFMFWWFPTSKGLVLSEGNIAINGSKGNATTNFIPESPLYEVSIFKILYEFYTSKNNSFTYWGNEMFQSSTISSLYEYSYVKSEIFTENGSFVNPATGPNYQMITNKCNKCAWDQTLSEELAILPVDSTITIPLSKFSDVIADMKSLFDTYPTPFPLIGLYFRFSPAAKGIMSTSNGEDAFHIGWNNLMRANRYEDATYRLSVMQSLSQLLIFKYGGRPFWGKNGLAFFSHDILAARYNIGRFVSAVQKYDPNGLFSNKFGKRVLGIGTDSYEISKKVVHCALLDDCICSKNSDCANGQVCGSLIGYNVCY